MKKTIVLAAILTAVLCIGSNVLAYSGNGDGSTGNPYPPMDFNQDCHVNLADFTMFAVHWLECTAPECD